MQLKEKVWLAFLEAHNLQDNYVRIAGEPLKLNVTQTPSEKQSSGATTASELISQSGGGDSETIIAASGDPGLIQLHQRMKAAERAIQGSPEYARYQDAIRQSRLVKAAYSADPVIHRGPNPGDILMNGGTSAQIDAAQAIAQGENDLQARDQARLNLRKQSDPVAKKAEVEENRASSALEKVRQRYAIPRNEVLAVFQRYLPSGGKGWSSNYFPGGMSSEIADLHPVYVEYGTWTY